MAKNKEIKTNAMRILDRMKIPYSHYTYECEEFVDGLQVADMLGLPHEKVYKTLVTQGPAKEYFVFVIPVAEELDLEKSSQGRGAEIPGDAACEGYQWSYRLYPGRLYSDRHGKNSTRTVIEKKAEALPTVIVSGGRIGSQIELAPADLAKAAEARFEDVVTE